MEKGIKEIKEMFKALELIAGVSGAIAKDGKVGVDDLQHLVGFGLSFQALIDGFAGIDEAVNEAKDLDKAEVLEIIGAGYAVVKAFEDAKK